MWQVPLCTTVRMTKQGPPTPHWGLSAAVGLPETAAKPAQRDQTDYKKRAGNVPKTLKKMPTRLVAYAHSVKPAFRLQMGTNIGFVAKIKIWSRSKLRANPGFSTASGTGPASSDAG